MRRWLDPALGKRRVLVAEDDPEMRAMLVAALAADGFEVDAVASGTELRDRLAPWLERSPDPPRCDAIVTDVMMPGMTGLEILAGLAGVRRRPVVVVITAFGDRRTHDRAAALGALCVLDKPFDIDDLRTILLNVAPGATDGGY